MPSGQVGVQLQLQLQGQAADSPHMPLAAVGKRPPVADKWAAESLHSRIQLAVVQTAAAAVDTPCHRIHTAAALGLLADSLEEVFDLEDMRLHGSQTIACKHGKILACCWPRSDFPLEA